MNRRFAMLDVTNSQRASRAKDGEDKFKLTNELKVITAPDQVFAHWSKVITRSAHGELIDPDTFEPFKNKKGWRSERGILNHEFFKWLGNLTYDDLNKMALYILMEKTKPRTFWYPKVTIKQNNTVLDSCFTYKEWAEKRKRKYWVICELDSIQPDLMLIDVNGEVNRAKWKEFKA